MDKDKIIKKFEADNKMYKKDLEKEEILSFPDLPLKDNVQMIINQCNKGYVEILKLIDNSINK